MVEGDLIGLLRAQHHQVRRVLEACEAECRAVEAGAPFDHERFRRYARFFIAAVDGTHHRSEQVIFKALAPNGVASAPEVVRALWSQHLRDCEDAKGIRDALKSRATTPEQIEAVLGAFREYVANVTAHMKVEESSLYPLAQRLLGPDKSNAVRHQLATITARRASVESWADRTLAPR